MNFKVDFVTAVFKAELPSVEEDFLQEIIQW